MNHECSWKKTQIKKNCCKRKENNTKIWSTAFNHGDVLYLHGLIDKSLSFQNILYFESSVSYLLNAVLRILGGVCNMTRTHNHLVCKWTLNHLAKLAEWLSCVVSTYLYDTFDFMFLSCYVHVSDPGVPWNSGKCRGWIHSETRTWHDREASIYYKFYLKDWFATKHYPQRTFLDTMWCEKKWINGSLYMMVLQTHSHNYKTLGP